MPTYTYQTVEIPITSFAPTSFSLRCNHPVNRMRITTGCSLVSDTYQLIYATSNLVNGNVLFTLSRIADSGANLYYHQSVSSENALEFNFSYPTDINGEFDLRYSVPDDTASIGGNIVLVVEFYKE